MPTRRDKLASIAEELARRPLHGKTMGLPSNIGLLTDHFVDGPRSEFEAKWCAAFVYHCCLEAGFRMPARHPHPVSCSFAGVRAWLEWAKLPQNCFYFSVRHRGFQPTRGDIVIYDRVFDTGPHDHMGVVLGADGASLRVAEGNINDISAVVTRDRNSHVRGYIRIPNDYRYEPGQASAGQK